jgi:hypothetical protein
LQEDLFYTLTTWDALNTVNIVQYRKLRIISEVNLGLICMTSRNGSSGMGIVIEMPRVLADPEAMSAPGPNTILAVSLLVVEIPTLNKSQSGSAFESSEQLADDFLKPFLHQWFVQGQGELYPDSEIVVPENAVPVGQIAHRVNFKIIHAPPNVQRVTAPTASIDGSFNVTLTNSSNNPNAAIFFTLDQSTPAQTNPAAQAYTGPFVTVPGQVLRWMAFQSGMLPSAIDEQTINP